jgi:hypothetical protein
VIPQTKYISNFVFPSYEGRNTSNCHVGSGYIYIFEYTKKGLKMFTSFVSLKMTVIRFSKHAGEARGL